MIILLFVSYKTTDKNQIKLQKFACFLLLTHIEDFLKLLHFWVKSSSNSHALQTSSTSILGAMNGCMVSSC